MNIFQILVGTLIFVLGGAGLSKLATLLGLPKGISTLIIGAIIALLLAGRRIFNMRKEVDLNKNLLPTKELLLKGDKKSINEFIKINEEYLSTIKNEAIRLKVILFLIVGYQMKNDYNTPRKLLEELDPKKLTKKDRIIHSTTLAVMSFKSGHDKAGYKIMEDNEKAYNYYRGKYDEPGMMVAYADIIHQKKLGNKKAALKIIENGRKVLGPEAYKEEYDDINKAM